MIEIRDTPGGFALIHKRGSRILREVTVRQPEERLLDVTCLDDPFNPKPERGSDAPPRRSSRPQTGHADQG
ncbi:hypothetical protein [Acidisoma sp. 7E03]